MAASADAGSTAKGRGSNEEERRRVISICNARKKGDEHTDTLVTGLEMENEKKEEFMIAHADGARL
jgi:hypothetical protein